MNKLETNELEKIKQRYEKRNSNSLSSLYLPSSPYIYMSSQEKERVFFKVLKNCVNNPLSELKFLELGCGRGYKILDLIRMGFSPSHIIGNELMPDNLEEAKRILPSTVRLFEGDARSMDIAAGSLNIVYQSMVFSSILDPSFQQELAQKMWQWTKPGGGGLWYDFTFNNPSNPDVRGVPVKRVHELFPDGKVIVKRITLAPPISRLICKIHPNLYHLFNMIPWLRTHVLIWIEKPKAST